MRHFLVTRFNDRFPTNDNSHSTSKNPDLGIEEGWLKERLSIFTNVTVPSIRAQSDQEFTWVIKCHPRTPEWARKILCDPIYLACYDPIPEFDNVKSQTSSTFSRLIRQMTTDTEIITTRIDSDDALSKDHLAIVKNYIQPNRFFDYSRGIVKTDSGIFIHYKPKVSQFCSYFDTENEIETVYRRYHSEITDAECLKNQVDLGWMQNNHRSNITANSRRQDSASHYPYKATTADWKTLKDNYPFLEEEWAHHSHPRLL